MDHDVILTGEMIAPTTILCGLLLLSSFIKSISQIHRRRAGGGNIPMFTHIYVLPSVCVAPADQTNNGTDL